MKSKRNEHSERSGWRRPRVALPVAHILALAPLDVWVGMLRRSGGVHPRYWPRLAFVLFTSFVGTVCTMHDRLLWMFYGVHPHGRELVARHKPRVVVIVGYYRSGTTHLHNLMSCDRRFVTPRWYQCLAGQGYWLGWNVMRVLLVPFLGRTRPQDSVGFGPEWPGEDDFALATWGGCSSIAGRHVFPDAWDDWKRWHDLEGLSDTERDRWRRLTKRFVYKLTRGRTKRVVLLKAPSHTARIAELDRLFAGRVQFVHLVREPGAVIDSNVRMMHALRNHALQALPDVQTIRDRIVEEYDATERKCIEELAMLDSSRHVRVRFKDLRSDPMGTLGTIYNGLGMEFAEEAKHGTRAYLGSLGIYSAERELIDLGHATDDEHRICDEMSARYGLSAPARVGKPVEYTPRTEARVIRGLLGALSVAMMCWGAWLVLVAGLTATGAQMRLVALVWPVGALIGFGARRASGGRGTRLLGLVAAVLTLIVVVTVLFPVSVIIWNWARDDGFDAWWYHNWRNVRQALSGTSSIVLVVLAMLTAYRHASEDGPIVPGR